MAAQIPIGSFDRGRPSKSKCGFGVRNLAVELDCHLHRSFLYREVFAEMVGLYRETTAAVRDRREASLRQ
jgi:hypothetical protein